VAVTLGSGACARPSKTEVDAAPPPPRICETTPPSDWTPLAEAPIADLPKNANQRSIWVAVSASRAGHRVAIATLTPAGEAAVELHDAAGSLLWKVELGASATCLPEIELGPADEVFAFVGCQIAPAQPLLEAGGASAGRAPLVKVAPDGSVAWVVALLEPENGASARGTLAVDGQGQVWVATTTLRPDQPTTTTASTLELVLERRDASDGHVLIRKTSGFVRSPTEPLPWTFVRLAGHPDGGVVLAGAASGVLDLSGAPAPLPAGNGLPNRQLVRLAADGTRLWTTILPVDHAPVTTTGDLAVDGQGNVILAGVFEDLLQVGDTLLGSHGQIDAFVAAFSPDGTPRWARSFGAIGNDWATALGVDDRDGTIRLATAGLEVALPDGALLESHEHNAVLVFSQDGILQGSRCVPATGITELAFDGNGGAFLVVTKTASDVRETRLLRLPPF
jgi:hypothetical protein